jgi:hypothetical protein
VTKKRSIRATVVRNAGGVWKPKMHALKQPCLPPECVLIVMQDSVYAPKNRVGRKGYGFQSFIMLFHFVA